MCSPAFKFIRRASSSWRTRLGRGERMCSLVDVVGSSRARLLPMNGPDRFMHVYREIWSPLPSTVRHGPRIFSQTDRGSSIKIRVVDSRLNERSRFRPGEFWLVSRRHVSNKVISHVLLQTLRCLCKRVHSIGSEPSKTVAKERAEKKRIHHGRSRRTLARTSLRVQ